MSESNNGSLDCIAVGEALVDLLTTDYVTGLQEATTFEMHPGGSPANLAGNLARLGRKSALVATLGEDGAGALVAANLRATGLDLNDLRYDPRPTTMILVTRSHDLPAFAAYREADAQILPSQLPKSRVAAARLFHTTAFGLSLEPARTSILQAAKISTEAGKQISIDANYAAGIWPDQAEARRVIEDYLSLGALAKFSEVDYQRLYGRPVEDPEEVGKYILDRGARLLCLTMGGEGAYVFTREGQVRIPARPIKVADTTGAGDAFWAGFLHAWLAGCDPETCGLSGRKLAEMKLTRVGPLPDQVPDLLGDIK